MRTLFWTCTLALFLVPCASAQDLAQLRKTIDDNMPGTGLPDYLGSKAPPQAHIDACTVIVDTATKIYALPNLDDANRYWALQRETFARIILAYADPQNHYFPLGTLSDELAARGSKAGLAKAAEEHVLKIGIQLVTQTGKDAMKIAPQSLAERMVMFAEQYPGQESVHMIEQFVQQVRLMQVATYRDNRLAVICPIFQEYFLKINHREKAMSLEPDIQRATLVGKHFILKGVDIDGKVFNPNSVDDKVVLLQFWGTWCGPCKEEIPDLIALYEKYHGPDFEIIGINTSIQEDKDEKHVKRWVDTQLFNGKRIPWKILHEGLSERQSREASMTKFYGITELPVLILIGKDGIVRNLHPAPGMLEDFVAKALSPSEYMNWTEEERKMIEENEKKRREEEREQINQLLSQ